MRRTVLAAAAVAVVAVAAGGFAVAAGGTGVVTAAHRAAAAPSLPAYVSPTGGPTALSDAVQDHADQVWDTFGGTLDQRNAAGVIEEWRVNGDLDELYHGDGAPGWDLSRVRTGESRTDALITSEYFSRPLAHAYSNARIDMAAGLGAEYHARVTRSAANTRTARACTGSVPKASDHVTKTTTPAVVRRLRSDWWFMLEQLDTRYGSGDAFTRCETQIMSLPDVDRHQISGADSWHVQLSQLSPPGNLVPTSPRSRLAASPGWTEFVADETAMERADWECRRDVYAAHLSDVAAAVDAFPRQHAAQIAQARAGWRQVVATAARLGYHGQTGATTR